MYVFIIDFIIQETNHRKESFAHIPLKLTSFAAVLSHVTRLRARWYTARARVCVCVSHKMLKNIFC